MALYPVMALSNVQANILYDESTEMTKEVVFIHDYMEHDLRLNTITVCRPPSVWEHPDVAEVVQQETMELLTEDQVELMTALYGFYQVIYV